MRIYITYGVWTNTKVYVYIKEHGKDKSRLMITPNGFNYRRDALRLVRSLKRAWPKAPVYEIPTGRECPIRIEVSL